MRFNFQTITDCFYFPSLKISAPLLQIKSILPKSPIYVNDTLGDGLGTADYIFD
ncbi:glycosyl transferase group 1 [Paenibacillus sp. NAIST15-1]|nr:glycosyl transferase group 1 [Paenibacillus sp. NAIST15-1]